MPKPPDSVASIRSVFNDRLTCSSSVRKYVIGIAGSALLNDRSNRLERALRRPSNPHVETAAGIAFLKNRKVRLFRLLTNAAIAEVRHHTDDFDIRLGIGSGALADARAERTAAPQVSLGKGLVDDRRRGNLSRPPAGNRVRRSPCPATILDSERSKESGADRIQIDVAIGDDSLIGLNRHGVVPASARQ